MNQTGHVKLHCKIQDWEWYSTPYMFHLFMHLVMCANTEDRKRSGRIVRRGQVLTTLNRLVEETGISKRSIRTCLERLQDTGEIQIETTKLFSIITVENYESYQIDIDEDETVKEQAPVQTELPLDVLSVAAPKAEKPKRPKKKAEKPTSIITLARQVFETYFNETYNDVYYWTAKDAGNMSQLLQKLKFQREQKQMDLSDDSVLYALQYLLSSIREGWIFENFSVANINSKFNEIVSQVKSVYNGNNRSYYTSKQEANDYAMQQYLADRAKLEQGVHDEVPKPF